MVGFEIIDHPSDTGLMVYGSTMEELFSNAACGMFSLMVDINQVEEKTHREVSAEAPDQGELLVTWLNELVYFFDAENLLFRSFKILKLDRTSLLAKAFGEEVNFSKHELKTPVKAATYHMLKLEAGDGFKAHIILDV